jgi:hypothetical protein
VQCDISNVSCIDVATQHKTEYIIDHPCKNITAHGKLLFISSDSKLFTYTINESHLILLNTYDIIDIRSMVYNYIEKILYMTTWKEGNVSLVTIQDNNVTTKNIKVYNSTLVLNHKKNELYVVENRGPVVIGQVIGQSAWSQELKGSLEFMPKVVVNIILKYCFY